MSAKEYQVCSKTVMDTSDPNIRFDSNGVSNHCFEFDNFIYPNWTRQLNDSANLERLVEKIKCDGKGRDFDCILGFSGGLDSSYMLHRMVTGYGLRPLVFHVDGGWNSEAAVHNIHEMVNALGLDLFTEVVNWKEMQDFQLAMFKSGVPHLDIPQDIAFIAVLYKFAQKHGIKYILNGGNVSTECVLMPLNILYWGTDRYQINDILKQFGTVPMTSFPFTNILFHKFYLKYLRGVKVIKPLNKIRYIKKEAEAELRQHYNWKAFPQKHFESRFTKFLEGYWLFNRFGYDMRRNQFSSLILTEQLSRHDAMIKLEKLPYDPADIENEKKFISMKMGISEDELEHYQNMPKKFYWNYKNQRWLFDLGETVLKLISGTRRGGAI